jgi:hypothetical protein
MLHSDILDYIFYAAPFAARDRPRYGPKPPWRGLVSSSCRTKRNWTTGMERVFFAKDVEPHVLTHPVSRRCDFIHRCESFVTEMQMRFAADGLVVSLASEAEPPQIAFQYPEENHSVFLSAWEEALPRFGIKLR